MTKLLIAGCLGLGLVLIVVVANAKSVGRPLRLQSDNDPMLALPSDYRVPTSHVGYQQLVPLVPQIDHHQLQHQHHQTIDPHNRQVVIEYHQVPAPVAPQEHQLVGSQAVYRPEQQQPRQPITAYQLIQMQAEASQRQQQQQQQPHEQAVAEVHTHMPGGPDCHQRHEYASVFSLESPSAGGQAAAEQAQVVLESEAAGGARPQGEYPGEIVYVRQGAQREQRSGLTGLAGSLTQNSDMPATILTEIPMKEMPHEVLNKLKREYGVKVVATRERPGANLVINCDDYSDQEGSVCGRQSRLSGHSQQPPYVQSDPQHQHQHQHQHQPYQPYQPQENYVYVPAHHAPTVEGHAIEFPTEHNHQSFRMGHEAQPTSEPAHYYVTHEQHSGSSQEVSPSAHSGAVEASIVARDQQQSPGDVQELNTSGHSKQPTAPSPSDGQSQPDNESAAYGIRTTNVVVSGEQQPGSESREATAEQPTPVVELNNHESYASTGGGQHQASANSDATSDQLAGFDDQPKSGEQDRA